MLRIEPGVLADIRAHAVETYPEECCGIVFSTPEGQVVRRMTNVQNQRHAEDPVAYPRDARTAYDFDPRELFELERMRERRGWTILVVYHSHPDHGTEAYFSATDRKQALTPWEPAEPIYEGAFYIVFAVCDRAVTDGRAFCWDEATRDFVETPLTTD